MTSRPLRKVRCLLFFVLLLGGCFRLPPSSWNIFPEPGYVKAGVDFSKHKNVCVLRFGNDTLEDEILEKFALWTARKFREKHYDVITEKDLGFPLEEALFFGEKWEDSPLLQKKIREFGISALVRGTVHQYVVEPLVLRAPGFQSDPRIAEYDVRSTCTVFFDVEILDIQDGEVLWSSSVSCRGGIIKGNPDKLLRRMVSEVLKTVPEQ